MPTDPESAIQSAQSLRDSDYQRLFESAPGLYLVLSQDLRIVAATDAYLRATMTERAAIVGRHVFDVFPSNPDDPYSEAHRNTRASIERVLHTGMIDTMPIQEYDLRKPEAEGNRLEKRFWSIIHYPVLGTHQEVAYILHRALDITAVVYRQRAQLVETRGSTTHDVNTDELDVDVFLRTREVAEANRKLKEANIALTQAQETIRNLSTPILQIKRGLLLVPVIGQLDSERSSQLASNLLDAISAAHASAVVLDLTGLAELDAALIRHLRNLAAACRLKGATVILTGLSVASTDAIGSHGGIKSSTLISAGDLEDGIARALLLLNAVTLSPAQIGSETNYIP